MKKIVTSFTAIALSLLMHAKLFAQTNVQDSLALVDVYNNTNGPDWNEHANWLNGPVPTWFGITVTGKRVTEINLSSNKLKGAIPASIGNLTALTSLFLEDNRLSGAIPSSIGNLNDLIYINLGGNQLTGTIPSTIGKLLNLQQLLVEENQLNGTIPSSIGNLTKLTELWLFRNQLSGSIPSSIGKLTSIEAMPMEYNQLSGNIPSGIGNLINLVSLELSNNQLTGEIPSSLGNLINLQYLELNNNLLSGRLPSELGDLANLIQMHLEYNKLKGKLPSSFHHLKKLTFLFLDHNRLSSIDSSITKLHKLDGLYLSHNRLTFDAAELVVPVFRFVTYDKQARIDIHRNGTALSVSAGGTLSNNTYQWFLVGQASSTIKGDSVFHPTQNGQYYVKVVNAIATELTLQSDTINYKAPSMLNKTEVITSVPEQSMQKNSFAVYPNPAKNVLYIRNNSKATFSLIDQSGKIVATVVTNTNGQLNVADLAPGLYYLRNNNTATEQKVMIVK